MIANTFKHQNLIDATLSPLGNSQNPRCPDEWWRETCLLNREMKDFKFLMLDTGISIDFLCFKEVFYIGEKRALLFKPEILLGNNKIVFGTRQRARYVLAVCAV